MRLHKTVRNLLFAHSVLYWTSEDMLKKKKISQKISADVPSLSSRWHWSQNKITCPFKLERKNKAYTCKTAIATMFGLSWQVIPGERECFL